ncbi:MAG: hypothetical protein NVS4B8_19020 [Herpetosiphon sp.]
MTWLKNFGLFWWDFIVGDDWVIAAGVVIALGISALLVRQGIMAWWVMLIAVAATLTLSIWRETRTSR